MRDLNFWPQILKRPLDCIQSNTVWSVYSNLNYYSRIILYNATSCRSYLLLIFSCYMFFLCNKNCVVTVFSFSFNGWCRICSAENIGTQNSLMSFFFSNLLKKILNLFIIYNQCDNIGSDNGLMVVSGQEVHVVTWTSDLWHHLQHSPDVLKQTSYQFAGEITCIHGL